MPTTRALRPSRRDAYVTVTLLRHGKWIVDEICAEVTSRYAKIYGKASRRIRSKPGRCGLSDGLLASQREAPLGRGGEAVTRFELSGRAMAPQAAFAEVLLRAVKVLQYDHTFSGGRRPRTTIHHRQRGRRVRPKPISNLSTVSGSSSTSHTFR